MISAETKTDYPELFRLDGKAFVVVGAGNGIGAESCRAIAALGGRVLCVDIDEDRARRIADEVDGEPCVADVSDPEGVAAVVHHANSALGGVTGLVDIVGFSHFTVLTEVTDTEFEAQLRLNLRHAFLLMRAVPQFVDRSPNGSMVFISSSLGLTGAPGQAIYGAFKSALVSLVRTAALEFAPIRVNSIAPGVIATPRLRQYLKGEALASFEANCPQGRLGKPQEVATVAAFLLSAAASFISGQALLVDGGVSAKSGYPDVPPP